ncbi:MAG: xanthine dehydrogenase family protein molybdopterin-binding subunit [Anaerolineae bacterium]|uniref:xanthine dehydrogenase family protein molybdopterin-binding subunit n=1 Tax=Candidatus Amarolinea dominans TaxID=3140696 RepID=UPI001E1A5B52|nr:xanthine dehydrogenase family protein [Anaerolineae bacterium]MBK7200458.1 xanthine dehydrogenase family protein [Anaerolineae bacterium]MBK9230804.1 xanthine dehydrogenase family protein [Anaerolineae bacterium]
MRAVGSSHPRADAWSKVTGAARYPGDIDLPDQLWMKILFAGRPHARIRALDTTAAAAAPGVVAVLTARDVPHNAYGLIIADQPVLCGPLDDVNTQAGSDIVRFVGDQVAVVVAETAAQAAAALPLIKIDYEDLPLVTDPLQAMRPDSPNVHPERPGNVVHSYRIRRGDVEAALAAAAVVIEQTYTTHAQEHAYLQPEAGVATVDESGLVTVVVAGQWVHEDRKEIAHALGLPVEQVRVIYPAIGGAFGGREDMSVQIVLALAAWRLHQRGIQRPVKIVWSREESIIGHHKRHPMVIKARWGASRDGRLLAASVDLTSDCGAYTYTSTKVLGNVTLMCLGPYDIPNVAVDARTVYTNNVPSGAFRGFGGPQGHFAAEMQMNYLAEALGLDPVEFRARNVLHEGSTLATRSRVPAGCTAPEVLARCATEAGWVRMASGWQPGSVSPQATAPADRFQTALDAAADDGNRRRGIGLALSYKNVGFSLGFVDECFATVELHGQTGVERVVVYHAGADVGQGAHQLMRQVAAEVIGVPLERVELIASDTAQTDNSGSTSASRMSFMAGNAIIAAARQALALWQAEEDRPVIVRQRYVPRPTTAYDKETGASDPNITYGYCAQAAAVEVDMETGHIAVRRLVSVNDVGKAINPQQVAGQIEGAVAQAQGWTLLEEFKQKDGQVLTSRLSTYLIPTIADVADVVEPVILEIPDPQGPLGARGMAEMPFIPTAPAIVAAVHAATGVWINDLPLTPERVWRALRRVEPHA